MNSKTFKLFGLTLLALVMFAGMASAATISEWNLTVDGSAINVNTDVTAGIFSSTGLTDFLFDIDDGANAKGLELTGTLDPAKYFEVTISPKVDHTLTISNINFDYKASIAGPADFEVKYSKDGFSTSTSLIIKDDVSSSGFLNSANTINIVINSGETLTLRWFGYNFDVDSNRFFIKDLEILGTAVSNADEPSDITSCSALSGVSGDLDIKIKDINIISGFGDDEDFWYPLDEIEVEIEVENNGDEDMDDIEVEWGLYDVDADEWIIDDEESDFNLKDGQDDTKYITFKLEDVDDLTGDEYVFYVWANAEIDDDDNTKVCDFDSQDIEIVNNDDFVILDDITYPATATCGSEIQITADVWNVGDNDQDEVTVVISNSELGIYKIVEIGDINDFDNEILDTFIEIPSDVGEKTYFYLFIEVRDEDNDVYETDEDEDESKYSIRINLEDCFVSSSALVSANLESGGKAGENLIVKSTIVNSGTKSATYTINAAGYAEWADSVSIDQTTFTIDVGASKEVLFTFDVKEDASGEKQFNIEVYSGNALVTTQPVQVEIEGTSSWLSGITGNAFVDGNKYLWGIGILNVILIIFIIIVAVRVARK